MIHFKDEHQVIQDPTNKIHADEPVFLLRGIDPSAPECLRLWSRRTKQALNATKDDLEEDTIQSVKRDIALAEAHAYRMEAYAARNKE